MQSRANGSFAFLCHEDHVDTLLCASGKDGLFIKCLSDDSLPLELLWLDPAVVLGDALNLAKDRRVFGLAEKGSTGLLALRFRDNDSLSKFAIERKMDATSSHARWKLTGFPIQGGLHALDTLLSQKGWRDVHALFLDEKRAVFLSTNRGEDLSTNRGEDLPLLWRAGAQAHQLRFNAVNAVARALAKEKTARQLLPQQLLRLPLACAPVSRRVWALSGFLSERCLVGGKVM